MVVQYYRGQRVSLNPLLERLYILWVLRAFTAGFTDWVEASFNLVARSHFEVFLLGYGAGTEFSILLL